ncbi:unnamed protein product [Protopolystoma xenopodis]|uniref:PAS domain-containing protein n=1 Tax=Protopolystoma xenopodis TaxID=117903 RepID=A0A3S5FGR8_9PLAT|nr:unnamed protein product [Protopolystoma xenopodis]
MSKKCNDYNYETCLRILNGTDSNFVLGNAQVREYPIVYCSDGFVELTGYSRGQIMSRCCSCSFLWGEKTNIDSRQRISTALQEQTELQIELIFHKKNGRLVKINGNL